MVTSLAKGTGIRRPVRVADEVWIATALLHREQPRREDFSVQEIVARAERERIEGRLRPGVYVHALQHCVANLPPTPGRYRMLFATGKNTRRLFRPGDPYDRQREHSKTVPSRESIPPEYHPLLDWYSTQYLERGNRTDRTPATDPILALRGTGCHLAGHEHPDDYVRRLREGWT